MAKSSTLMAAGPYGMAIHAGRANSLMRREHEIASHPHCYNLCAIQSGTIEMQDGEEKKRLRAPTAALLVPCANQRVHIPGGGFWWYLRFDVVHVPRRQTQSAPQDCR